jgi:CO/xanthine dehydrogenase FAD-binding subunit
MRADPREFALVAPGDLRSVLALMDREPGVWTPIAGGTDLMVLYSAGKLAARKLVSIWNLPQLRDIEVLPQEIRIGAGCTYSGLREHETLRRELPMLATAASWTGGIANQNRGTLGGNIVNASPAADSLPALLVYEATLVLVSARGEREVPYVEFHRGYKDHALQAGELIRTIRIPRRYSGYFSYTRKVGARRAQAISKVSIAALAKVEDGTITDARIAVGSVAPVPLRLAETEKVLIGRRPDPGLGEIAAQTIARQIRPIDDIRSSANYRSAVTANLVTEFLRGLCREVTRT